MGSTVTQELPWNNLDLAKAKQYLRVTHDLEDDLIADMLASAAAHCETLLGWQVLPVELQTPSMPFPMEDYIILDRYPVMEVVSVDYKDDQGLDVSMDVNDFTFDPQDKTQGKITLRSGVSWPVGGDVSVTYLAGNPTVDPMIRKAIYFMLGFQYERREDTLDARTPHSVHKVLRRVKNYSLGA